MVTVTKEGVTEEKRTYNRRLILPAIRNEDESYSVRIPAKQFVEYAFVDFYDEANGTGYQRHEAVRDRRGREIADFIARSMESGIQPHLFEMTANARLQEEMNGGVADYSFKGLDDSDTVGTLTLRVRGTGWLSMIDGGTRLLGIQKSLEDGVLAEDFPVDVRLFVGLTVAQEIAMFLLVNEKQKRVRTDLGVRVVQRLVDEGMSEEDAATLSTVVPNTTQWRYEASRIAARLNADPKSPWRDLIQQPNEYETKPIKLQAFWTSLRGLLTDEELTETLTELEERGELRLAEGKHKLPRTDFILQVLKNFWNAVEEVNPDAGREPFTNVLWGSIGVNAAHTALVPILNGILASEDTNLTQERFEKMLKPSVVADYNFWFTRPGDDEEVDYPDNKGEATRAIGASGYARLAKQLEKEWRKALHKPASSAKA